MANQLRPDDLLYAAYSRCPCGAGIATRRNAKTLAEQRWDCSAILLGEAIPSGQPDSVQHCGEMPYAFYEIKSENQPSAQGATTRPKKGADR